MGRVRVSSGIRVRVSSGVMVRCISRIERSSTPVMLGLGLGLPAVCSAAVGGQPVCGVWVRVMVSNSLPPWEGSPSVFRGRVMVGSFLPPWKGSPSVHIWVIIKLQLVRE
jgi:hypothetical protein